MSTIVDKLNLLLENKNAIKAILEEKGKEPSDVLSTYAQSISELDNEEQVSYVLSNSDGSKKIYAQLSSKEPITLTATENDIRLGSTAITNEGFVEGTKDIPSYHSWTGKKIIQAGSAVTISIPKYQYTQLLVTLSNYNTSISKSVEVVATNIEDEMYEAKTTTKLADITLNDATETIDLGITADVKSVLRYFTMKEE
jgi:hypothetical protein